MKPMTRTAITICVLFCLSTAAALAAGTSEARGRVTDPDGNPLQGVVITFSNTANETAVYTAKTSKKGRFYLSGLLYYATGQWKITAELEGYVATHRKGVSKTQQAVIGEIDDELKPGKRASTVIIRPFGELEIDFVLTPEEVLARARAEVEENQAAEQKEAAKQQQQADPYAMALQTAAGGDLEGSVEHFEKAIKEKKNDPERFEAYAKVLYQMGRQEQAEARAREAIALDPQAAGPYLVLYGIHVSKKDYDSARADLDKASELNPNDMQVMEQRAWLATETGRGDDAIAAYEAITAKRPDHKEAWITLGGLYAKAGRNDLSEQAYQKVVELDPGKAYKTFFNIGALIENKPNATDQDIRRAIEAYRKAIEIKPDYAQAHKRLAFALLRTGDPAGTRVVLERYLELSPNGADAAQVKGMLKTLPK